MASSGSSPPKVTLRPLPPFKPELFERAWASVPHPTLPLLATCHAKAVTVYSLSTLSKHSIIAGGHDRSVRAAAWKPGMPPHKLCLGTGSFDSTAALWRWDDDSSPSEASHESAAAGAAGAGAGQDPVQGNMEVEITSSSVQPTIQGTDKGERDSSDTREDWEFTLVLEGHDSEVKSVAFSPSAQYLATCSRDKTVWVWEDVGASEADDEWETVAVLNEHDGDVKSVAWCPDVPGRTAAGPRNKYSADVLASASYDNTVRIWREDGDGEWVCVAVLEGHQGTVWGVQWEPDPERQSFPRLMTFSADKTIRIWTLKEDEDGSTGPAGPAPDGNPLFSSGLGRLPNTMRRSLEEDWECTAVLPSAHSRDVYSATWSATTGLVASTGSDGVIAVYREDPEPEPEPEPATAESGTTKDVSAPVANIEFASTAGQKDLEAETSSAAAATTTTTNGSSKVETNGGTSHTEPSSTTDGIKPPNRWRLLTSIANGHGPYEINHITWCRRYDPGAKDRGIEEMLVTTGDNGAVRPWEVLIEDTATVSGCGP